MLHTFLPLIILFILLAVIGIMLKVVLPSIMRRRLGGRVYEKEPALLSPGERSFFGVLEQAVNKEVRLMCKVRLADVVKVRAGFDAVKRQSAFNRIQSKHLDFVACDPATYAVLFAVELDDKSHNHPKRRDRDEFVDTVLNEVGVPIFHFAAKGSYSMQEVRDTLLGNGKEKG